MFSPYLGSAQPSYLVPIDKCCTSRSCVKIHEYFFTLKKKLIDKYKMKYFKVHEMITNYVLRCEEVIEFYEVIEFFNHPKSTNKGIRNIVKQSNVLSTVTVFYQ